MKFNVRSILVLVALLTLHASVCAQEATTAAETVEDLRLQLIDVQTREQSLRIREQQLDEDLKPENIERALAGIGSTKPEELRDYRRRQLTIERDSVLAQLKIIETVRSRLEGAIATAEARAYQESAFPIPSAQVLVGDSFTLRQTLMMIPFILFLILLAAVIVLKSNTMDFTFQRAHQKHFIRQPQHEAASAVKQASQL